MTKLKETAGVNKKQIEELILQSLEHERGGVKVYTAALTCTIRHDLKAEWEKYLAETRTHVKALEDICKTMKIDPKRETPGRAAVRHLGAGLIEVMELTLATGDV